MKALLPFAPGSSPDPLLLGVRWVQTQLQHNPRTRHLQVQVSAQGDALVLEGWASNVTEKLWAEQVARKHQTWGRLENRIDVFDGSVVGLSIPPFEFAAVPTHLAA